MRSLSAILVSSSLMAACSGASDPLFGDAGSLAPQDGGGIPVVEDAGTDAAPASSPDSGNTEDAGPVDATAPADAGGGSSEASAPSSDAASPIDASPPDDPCAGGSVGASSDAGGSTVNVSGYGFVSIDSPPSDPIVSVSTTLLVPPAPPASGTVFLWPGLQAASSGANYDPIDNGVLQPVVTWGPTCAPNSPSSSYASWWVSAQYVNTIGKDQGYTGCQGGTGMNVAVGDRLRMTMTLSGHVWTESVVDARTGQSVTFQIDMQGQSQNYAEFAIEGYMQGPTVPVQFTDTVVTMTSPSPGACQPMQRGATDTFSTPRISPDGKTCCYDAITLHPQGI
ncbi:MAG TPA: hypothetical protein VGI39_42870 [Polyangiaceae bacterium]|jgi:hypothetical protein